MENGVSLFFLGGESRCQTIFSEKNELTPVSFLVPVEEFAERFDILGNGMSRAILLSP
jgi:hypothetical protein